MNAAAIVSRVFLVLVVAALAGAAAFAISSGQPKEYRATTDLMFESFASPELQILGPGFAMGGPDADRRTATNLVLVKSRDVAVATARADPGLHMSAAEIASKVDARAPGPVDLIRLTATGDTAQKAERLVLEYRKQFKLLRRDHEQRRARSAMRALQDALNKLAPRLRNGAEGESLRQQIGALEVMARLGSGLPTVTEGAYAPTAAVAQTGRNVLFGLLFGALLGVGLVALRSAAVRERMAGSSAVGDERHVRSDWE
jgi:hypothetical protein